MPTAVVICPGRGTYGPAELGYLARHHAGAPLLAEFDAQRRAEGQETLADLDGAARYSPARHTRGDNASALIYAASVLDAMALPETVEIVAVTGNSMGFYSALAVAGAVRPSDSFRIANTMGMLMQQALIGGQLVYPCTGADWRDDPAWRGELLDLVADIGGRSGHDLALSIDLGGLLVVAGNEAGLSAFEAAVPRIDGRFPMRLTNHAAFHTALQAPVAKAGQERLDAGLFSGPKLPLIDGRGAIWWPQSTDPEALWAYTLGTQVTETYDFFAAIRCAAREFAPDLFIVTGPGGTLGGSVAQSLVRAGWRGLRDKAQFRTASAERRFLIGLGVAEERGTLLI